MLMQYLLAAYIKTTTASSCMNEQWIDESYAFYIRTWKTFTIYSDCVIGKMNIHERNLWHGCKSYNLSKL